MSKRAKNHQQMSQSARSDSTTAARFSDYDGESSVRSEQRRPWWRRIVLPALIVVATFAAYHNSFDGPFVFDDHSAIVENASIRKLWPLSGPLSPPLSGAGAVGRPLVNLSFAANYAVGKLDVRGYHAANLAIHACAALTLFAVVRRTLRLPSLRARFRTDADLVAGAITLVWAVHPLLTESVTSIVQRNESLSTLLLLLTLYAFIRSTDGEGPSVTAPRRTIWSVFGFLTCLAGMATKEIMATAPLLVILYDRSFVSGTFRDAWRRHRGFFLTLASTWILLAYLIIGHGGRNSTVGFNLGISPWHYALTQCEAIARYLWLSVWPQHLVFDYGSGFARSLAEVAPFALVLALVLTAAIYAFVRHPMIGFPGAWFFVILAPSSSVLPLVTQTMAEHRMYAPLIAIVALLVLTLFTVAGRAGLAACVALAVALGARTVARNEDYRSAIRLWTDTAAKAPENSRAFCNLGGVLLDAKRIDEAIVQLKEAVRVDPYYPEIFGNLAFAYLEKNEPHQALEYGRKSLELAPDSAFNQFSVGRTLEKLAKTDEAITHYREALRLQPDFSGAETFLGALLVELGHAREGAEHLEKAVLLRPDRGPPHFNLGIAYAILGRSEEALTLYEQAVRLDPKHAEAYFNLANLLCRLGRHADSLAHYEAALRAKPDYAEAHNNLGVALIRLGRLTDARQQFEETLRVRPDHNNARENIAYIEKLLGR